MSAVRLALSMISVTSVSCLCLTAALETGDPAVARSVTAGRWDERAMARIESPPLGLPPVPIPADNPVSPAKIALGRKLFFDRRLSFNGTMSCAMCHIPEQGFTHNELATSVGVEGRSLRRNAPTILNTAYSGRWFHDGREVALETQAINPLLAREEMANPSAGWVLEKVRSLPDYDGLFERAFGGAPSLDAIGKAIACWERSVLGGDSAFDRWRYGGESDALSAEQQRGYELFVGKARCADCHVVRDDHALFTDLAFHNTGIGYRRQARRRDTEPVLVEIEAGVVVSLPRFTVDSVGNPAPSDLGRFELTLLPEDRWRFRTPGLRDVALTAPYMHDGSMRTLREVVEYYNKGAALHPELDPVIRPPGLSADEIEDLISFLHGLTSGNMNELIADARSIEIGN